MSKKWAENHPYVWQAHLERIGDFIQHGPGVWWRDLGDRIEFLDGHGEENTKAVGPPLHHYRSYSVKEEQVYVTQCWNETVTQNVKLPHCTPRIYNQTGDLLCIQRSSEAETDYAHAETEQASSNEVEVIELLEVNEDQPTTSQQSANKQPTIQQSEQEPTHPIQPTYKYATSLGKELAGILGDSSSIKSFDILRNELKKKKSFPVSKKMKYEQITASLQTQLVKQYTEHKETIKAWETHFTEEHGIPPDTQDIPGHIAAILRQKRVMEKVAFHEWNLTL